MGFEEKFNGEESIDKENMNDYQSEESPEKAEINEDAEFEELAQEDVHNLECGEETELLDEKDGLIKELNLEKNKLFTTKKKLENELETIKERFLRMNAEYENFRKRTEKEKKVIYTDACTDVLKNILPVFDNLQRAIIADGSAEDLKKGIESTIKQFQEALNKLGVEEVETTGGFDPEYHEAIMHVEDSNFGEKEIVEVFQKGFKRGEKVLRHSLVKVAN
ncbi:nucleotide exchange factor GrpE [Clostridium grantii]|uniref:Protein GrpE n=1 Tax=Clostridium grantii DSM 8605 TaxID=1121316 RepID=A0A1M5XKU0_9CLOT|nr:nucleotide exchange factor GrpE [Clostridium grantii]SHI00349.1 molecular chaperone GrpE [Clostridium grantii DSM 8605]